LVPITSSSLCRISLYILALMHVVCQHALIVRVSEYLGHTLVAYLQPLFGKPCPYLLDGDIIEGFPMECLSKEPSSCIDHDLSLAVLPDHLETYRRLGGPIAT